MTSSKTWQQTERQRAQAFDAEERATRPAGVVTAGAGSDYERVRALRVKHGLPAPRPAAGVDDGDMIDRD